MIKTRRFPADPTRKAFEYFDRGDLENAESCFREILSGDPVQPDAWHGMACLARAKGQNASAIALAGRALQLPDLALSLRARLHLTLGLALVAEGHVDAARAALVVSSTLQPADPRAYAALAEVLVLQGRRREGREALETACGLAARDVEYVTRLGELWLEEGEFARAEAYFRRVVARRPQDGRAGGNLGAALFSRGQFDEALIVLERACALEHVTAQTLNNLGLVQMAVGALPEARETLMRALQLAPDDGRIANSLGTVLMEMEDDAAGALFEAVMERSSGLDGVQARFNLATIRLGRGEFLAGWHDFESRHGLLGYRPELPVWDGSAGDEPVVVTSEQGLGDSVQFLRYLEEVTRRRRVRLRFAGAELVRFMPGVEASRVLDPGGDAAFEVSLLSLPFVLGEEGGPERRPYLEAQCVPEELVIGVCWAGNPSYRFDRRRSVPREWLEALRAVEGVRFVSLQRGEGPEWMEQVPLETLEDLAGAVSRCALVVSADTLVGHMAGAIGRPLWLLNRLGGDWRWKDVCWYENVRMFRPLGFGPEHWAGVMDEVAGALRIWKGSRVGEGCFPAVAGR